MEEKRNYGIDALRIIAMFYVIILHCLNQGGLLKATIGIVKQHNFSTLLNICAYPAVDIFALISGYVAYKNMDKPTKYSRYIDLWMQVVFYGLLIYGVFNIIMPQSIIYKDFITAIFPVTNKLYWYFTAYTGLFILIPYLNKAIKNMNNTSLKKLAVLLFISFSIFDTFSKSFYLENGYSVIWLIILYIIGATMKKCDIGKNLKSYQALLGIIGLYTLTFLYFLYGPGFKTNHLNITRNVLVSYTSPTILGSAILYVILFSKLKFHNITNKVIKFFAPTAFAIYIINCHGAIWTYVMKSLFVPFANKRLLLIFVSVIGFSIIFSLLSMLVDKIRILIFKLFKIDKLTIKIETLIRKIFNIKKAKS